MKGHDHDSARQRMNKLHRSAGRVRWSTPCVDASAGFAAAFLAEALERRTLLTASVDLGSASLQEGVLTLVASPEDDVIGLTLRSAILRVRCNGTLRAFDVAAVREIDIFAGEGNDWIDWTGLAVSVYADAGPGADSISAGAGDDWLTGGAGRDTLRGGPGDDRIKGTGGKDSLFGEDGKDRIYGGTAGDWIEGGADGDRLWGEGGDDSLLGGNGDDALSGGVGDDCLSGGAGDDLLTGDQAADTCFGNLGNDRIYSHDTSADMLYGGGGHDLAQYDDVLDTASDIELILPVSESLISTGGVP